MASVQTGIQLNDQFSSVINGIINSVNICIATMEDMQGTMSANVDTNAFEAMRNEITQATIAADELGAALGGISAPSTSVPTTPEPVEIPVVWKTDNLDIFQSSGIDRFEQEVQSANNMLETLSNTQNVISKQAYNTMIFPPEAAQNLNSMAVRIDNIKQRIQQISSNKMNIGTDAANDGLEELRAQLNQALQQQEALNSAVENMDVSTANEAYLQLSQTVGNTERYIRDNVDEQGNFNQKIQQGTQEANTLVDTIKKAAAAYLSIQTVKNILDISDDLTQTTARIDMMNDGLQSTPELINMIYAAAQDARGSFSDMASVVAKLGNNAGDAFSSSEEIVAFADLVQKEMNLAGASTQEASNAMLQLTQALGSGVLRGDELNSIFEQAPNLIQNISKYIEENEDLATSMADAIDVSYEEMSTNAQGHIRELAAEGLISADIVKTAVFNASDDINAQFNTMPMTWAQVWQSMQNTALIAFQPVLNKINELANSAQFQAFVNNAIGAIATLAEYALSAFDLMAQAASWVEDNWSVIEPIVFGAIAAFAAYNAALLIGRGIQLVCAAATAIHTAATSAWSVATFMQTVQQEGLNAALAACPITWIVVGIIALIAVIYAVCQAIANMTGVANTGFGIITGGINVVIAFFKNLGLTVANIFLGIGNAVAALGSNMMVAFNNAICNIQAWFYNLLATAIEVIEGICAELNKLPFVEFDYSGITSAADDYAAKASAAAGNTQEYTSISDAFKEGASTFDAYTDGWVTDAFESGASWGDSIADKLSSLLDFSDAASDLPDVSDYTSGFSDIASNAVANGIDSSGLGDSAASTAGSASAIEDTLDITEEELKYLRDIAEQEVVNRYTTAEITIEQTNNNSFSSDLDLDGVVDGLTSAVNEAVDSITEGVH